MKSIQKPILLLTLFSIGLLPFIAAAQPEAPITSVSQLNQVLRNIVNYVRIIFFILTGLFLVMAAFRYLTSGGDEDKVKGAKNMLIYAIVAIVVALIATGITSFLQNVIQGQ